MLTIPLRNSKTKWLNFDKVKFKIGYLTLEQDDILKGLLRSLGFADPTLITKGELTDEVSSKKRSELYGLYIRYYRLFLKYTIKDWEGIIDEVGKKVKCKIFINEDDEEKGTELDNHQWIGLCKSLSEGDLSDHWARIFNEIKFNDVDKKK